MNYETPAASLAQLRDKDVRALYPVLAASAALALAVVAVFTIDALLARFESSTTGILLLGILVASQFISAAMATSKLQELVWSREYIDGTVAYLRTLPMPRARIWFIKVQITAIGGAIVLALLCVSFAYGIPYVVNVFGTEPPVWGIGWFQRVMKTPGASIFIPSIIYVLAGLALLSYAYTCAPVGARRWRQRQPVWLDIAGRRFSAHRLNAGFIVLIGVTLLSFSALELPIIIPASLISASLIVWYLSSYLAFSAIPLSPSALRRWAAICAIATAISCAVFTATSVSLSGAQSPVFRLIGYALARPLGTTAFSNRLIEQMQTSKPDTNDFIATGLATHLLSHASVLEVQPRLAALMDSPVNCAQRGVALALLAVDAEANDRRIDLLVNHDGIPVSPLQNTECALPASDFAILIRHFATETTALKLAETLLHSTDTHSSLIGAELAARLAGAESTATKTLKHSVLRSMPEICAWRPDTELRASYVHSHLIALSLLTLHENLLPYDEMKRALDSDCIAAMNGLLSTWTPIVRSQDEVHWDFHEEFARDFEFATGARFDFDSRAMARREFRQWTLRDIAWDKLDAPMRCYLAREWYRVYQVPPLFATQHLLGLPTFTTAFGISTRHSLFSERDCH